MKTGRNYLLLAIHAIGVLLLCTCFFFGLNYYLGGAIAISIPSVLVLAIILFLTVAGMVKFKSTEVYAKKAKINEAVLGGLYVVLAFVSAFFIYHFVTIALNTQTEIQRLAEKQFEEIEHMFGNDEGSYQQYVIGRLLIYKEDLKNQNDDLLQDKLSLAEDNLMAGYKTTVGEKERIVADCQAAIRNWNWLTVSAALEKLTKNKRDWQEKLTECSMGDPVGKKEPFQYHPEYNEDLTLRLSIISGGGAWGWTIIVLLFLHFIILLVYLATPRGITQIGPKPVIPGVTVYKNNK